MLRVTVAQCMVVGVLAAVSAQAAEAVKTPYETVVTADTEVLSGQGKSKHYVTGRLKAGDRVTVHRHDPGGWYMISPPAGSFDWIPAKSVQRDGDHGTIVGNNVAVSVGSVQGDEHFDSYRRLNAGDEVRILGEKHLATSPTDTAQKWYKIEPPPKDWRWIKGTFVASLNSPGKSHKGAVRAPAERAKPAGKSASEEAPATRKSPLHAPDEPEEPAEPVAENATGLPETSGIIASLDEEFQQILNLDMAQWEFSGIQAAYRQARGQVATAGARRLIDRRLASIQEYAAQRDAIVSEQVERREIELAAKQAELEARLYGRSMPVPAAAPATSDMPASHPAGNAAMPRLAAPQLEGPPQPTVARRSPRFSGAGVVRQSPAGSPTPFCLTTLDGRVLAFLAPQPGLDLSRWVGHPAGVHGARSHRAEIQADEIQVTGLEPVRLQ